MAEKLLLSPENIRNFRLKVARGGPDDCWLWTGWLNHSGHPRFEVAGDKLVATQLALILDGQPRPPAPNDNALHGDACTSPSCVNPAHLRWGSHKDNSADRERLGRRLPARGEGHGMAKLDEDAVRFIRARPDLSARSLARRFGVSPPAVRHVRIGKTWAHVA